MTSHKKTCSTFHDLVCKKCNKSRLDYTYIDIIQKIREGKLIKSNDESVMMFVDFINDHYRINKGILVDDDTGLTINEDRCIYTNYLNYKHDERVNEITGSTIKDKLMLVFIIAALIFSMTMIVLTIYK